jgi:hypothetical protein
MLLNGINRISPSFQLKSRESINPTLLLAGSLALYYAVRSLVIDIAMGTAEECLWLDIVVCAAAAMVSSVRYADIPEPLRLLGRGIGMVVLVQVAFDGSTLLYAPQSILQGDDGAFYRLGTVLALAAGIGSLWRPSFLLPLMFHYVAFRHQLNLATKVDISETDYLSMLDVGEYCVLGGIAIALTCRGQETKVKQAAAGLIWAWAVGAHLGNYLVSGWTKIRVGGDDPLFWLLHNPTQTSILIGLERGDSPFGVWPKIVQMIWNGVVGGGVFLNAFVLGSQLCAPLAATNKRVLMALTLIYDLFHVGVYFTLGALFIFWIAVNLLICDSARVLDKSLPYSRQMKLTLLFSVFVSHYLFYTSHLGWLDGAKLASPNFFAETRDGRMVEVPSVYWGIRSYSIAQTIMYAPDGHFPVRIGGNSYNQADWRDAQACGPLIAPHQTTTTSLAAVVQMVRENDQAMRAAPLVKQDNLYYFYPHHMMANPWLFQDFNALSMDDIVRYHYVVDSVCLGLKDGRLTRDVRKTTDIPIDVDR